MNGITAYPPLRYGFPAGICLTGMGALIWPGASAGALCFGWAALYLLLIASYRNASWSCTPGGWLLWGASVALWTGIAVNCHYYITVLGITSRRPLSKSALFHALQESRFMSTGAEASPLPSTVM